MYTACIKHLALAALIVAPLSSTSFAQQPVATAPGETLVSNVKISGAKISTPEYQIAKSQFKARTRDWFQITTTYETKPEWLDEVSFKYYVLVRNKMGEKGNRQTLFSGDVTYVNVQQGKHKSDEYLHPSTIARYGDVQAVAVIVSVQGKVEAIQSMPASTDRWWEKLTPVDGQVLNRMQTPFAMLYFDDYEAVKPKP